MNIYRKGKSRLNYLFDRIIDQVDMVLLDAYRLPGWIPSQPTKTWLRYLGDVCWLLKDLPRLPAYKLTGPDWTIVFVGSEKNLPEIEHVVFKGQKNIRTFIGRVALWQIESLSKQWLANDVDMVICERSRLFPFRLRLPIVFSVPTWIQQEIELPEKLDGLLTGKSMKTVRHGLNRAEEAGFSWYFSQNKEAFDFFHYHMYRPFIESRHKERALTATYEDQRQRWFTRGGLIMITKHHEPVAGLLCYLSNNTFYAVEGGVLNGNMELFTEGIKISSTWFGIAWAHQHGAKVYNMGGTRPLRSDGVFFTKSRWRAKVAQRQKVYGVWTFLAQTHSQKLQDYVNECGFISEIETNFYGIYLTGSSSTIGQTQISQELLAAKKQGLAGIVVVAPDQKAKVYE